MHDSEQSPTLLYIASSPRSGSTLLDMLLGNHEQMVSVGELRRVDKFYSNNELCTCGISMQECAFWQTVETELSSGGSSLTSLLTQPPPTSKYSRHYMPILLSCLNLTTLTWLGRYLPVVRSSIEAARNHWLVIDAVSRISEAPIVVDSSKLSEPFKLLYLLRPKRFKLIFLIRDGRGYAYSVKQRMHTPVNQAARSWASNNLKTVLLHSSIPKDQKLILKYEDLCLDPEAQLRRICDFVGVPFDEHTLKLSKTEKHNVGGSPHRFNKTETKVILDERWKQGLTPQEQEAFNWSAGFVNRLFGYSSSKGST